jgi:Protein of unknown function, DUF481
MTKPLRALPRTICQCQPGSSRLTGIKASFRKPADKRVRLCGFSIAMLFFAPCILCASSREKTDVISMSNGDKITCEIRSLEKGQLTVKPDYTDSAIVIDWAKVSHVESHQGFVVTLPNGRIYTGELAQGKEARSLDVIKDDTTTTLPYDSVVEVEELGETFLKRMRGDVDLGISFARSNSQKNVTLQGDLNYQSEKHLFSLDANSQVTTQEKTSNTNETTLKTSLFRQIRKSNWYAGGLANFLSSSEQQIDLRSTLGLGLANRVIFTNRTNLNVVGGLAYTTESDAPNATSSARNKSLDSAFALQFSTFRFDSTTFDTTLWVYPNLTSPGRVRMTLNQDTYYKFLGDFYIRLSFYDNYDNQPVIGAPTNNLGGSTTIGWSFH